MGQQSTRRTESRISVSQLLARIRSTRPARALPAAAELVSMKPDVMFVYGGRTVLWLRAETRTTMPIVFVGSADPVGEGIVASFSSPAGVPFAKQTSEQNRSRRRERVRKGLL